MYFKVNGKHVIIAFSGIHSRGHLLKFHMKEITNKTKETKKVLPETKTDYLLFGPGQHKQCKGESIL